MVTAAAVLDALSEHVLYVAQVAALRRRGRTLRRRTRASLSGTRSRALAGVTRRGARRGREVEGLRSGGGPGQYGQGVRRACTTDRSSTKNPPEALCDPRTESGPPGLIRSMICSL